MARTVMQVLDEAAQKWGAQPALAEKKNGSWKKTSWSEYRAAARKVARGFIKLGVTPGTGVSIIGWNRPRPHSAVWTFRRSTTSTRRAHGWSCGLPNTSTPASSEPATRQRG